MQKNHIFFILVVLGLLFGPVDSHAQNSDWININGTVTYEGAPVCAMALANGQYMFTCSGDGSFNLDVPLDSNGQITVFSFVSGLAPFKDVIFPADGQDMQIVMQAGDGGDGMDISYLVAATGPSRAQLSGTVTYKGAPVCAMVLANGQYMFSCSGDGSFLLDIPLDSNDGVTLFGFVSGLPPYKEVFALDLGTGDDVDSDGYRASVDCDEADASINPGAIDTCEDGIDQNCDGSDSCGPFGDTWTNSQGMIFKRIAAGDFTMGSPVDETIYRGSNETQHEVTLTSNFYMMTTEVTQGQWQAMGETNNAYFGACGADCPIEQVSWDDIQTFIDSMNALGEGTYRLPTEAEWEYAARAGSTEAFANGPISDDISQLDPNLDLIGWYGLNSGSPGLSTHPVGQKEPNNWGLYDMHGNVWEWVQDYYGGDYTTAPQTDPEGPETGSTRVTRGGGFNNPAPFCRAAYRFPLSSGTEDFNLGFRLVIDP